jgi:hypothetical protein
MQNANAKTCSNVSLKGAGCLLEDISDSRMSILPAMLAAAVKPFDKPGLPFNQSLQHQCTNLPLAYTRRTMIKLTKAHEITVTTHSFTRALSRVILGKRLPCGQCKSSPRTPTLIYLLVAL